MKRIRRILAWIGLIVIVGLIVATIVTSIQGSTLSIPMLGLTMGVSVAVWVLLWFLNLLGGKSGKEQETDSKEK